MYLIQDLAALEEEEEGEREDNSGHSAPQGTSEKELALIHRAI